MTTNNGPDQPNDPTEIALNKIAASFDRFQEAHFWIHSLERWYHEADQFRWHLSAFLKALKETQKLLSMELQNEAGFVGWFGAEKAKLSSDPLLGFLSKQRDVVVHRGMLKPSSKATIGLTNGQEVRLGVSMNVNPLEDSDTAMRRYLHVAAGGADFLGLLIPDDDTIPCVHRQWRLTPLNEEVISLAAKAWLTVGKTMTATVRWLGADVPDLSLQCRHSSNAVQFKTYDRDQLAEDVKQLAESRKQAEQDPAE